LRCQNVVVTPRRILAEIRDLRLESREHQRRANELMEEIRDEMRLSRQVIRRNELAFQQGATALGELVEEIRAQTQAIFKLIDRLDGGTAPA
jgi:hypothetical protein